MHSLRRSCRRLGVRIFAQPHVRLRSIALLARARHQGARDSQVLRLADGRTLGYAEYGDLTGYPLLYFHGFPSSRLEASMVDKQASLAGFRLVAPDRPGFGLSTYQKDREIVDWPLDVKELADHLKLQRFSCLGSSGGTPYALACAHILPRLNLKIDAIGLMSSAPPWEVGSQKMTLLRRMISMVAKHSPGTMWTVSALLLWAVKKALRTKMVTSRLDEWLEKDQAKDEGHSCLATQKRREQLLRLVLEGLAEGVDGFVQETNLLTQQWGFRLDSGTYDKIQIWHGRKDTASPIDMILWMADCLRFCDLKVYDEHDHGSLFGIVEEILSDLKHSIGTKL